MSATSPAVQAVLPQADAMAESSLEFVRLGPPDGKPRSWFTMRYLAWLSVITICSFFYIVAFIFMASIALLCSEAYRYHGLAVLGLLGALSVWPNSRWPAVHASFWIWADIFNIRVSVPRGLDPSKRYLFVNAPHAVYPFWSWPYTAFLAQTLGKPVGGGVASVLLRLPLMRQICTWTGCIPASYADLKRGLLKESQQIVVEGIAGIFAVRDNFRNPLVQTIDLSNRKGFAKLALQTGAAVVPVYCFGANDTFALAGGEKGSLLYWLSRKLRVSLTLFYGQFGLPIPFAADLCIVHGEVCEVKQCDSPTAEQIDALHAQFVSSLAKAFDQGKAAAGVPEARLIVH
jgi:2-acylglycerol O-acyltransferase 2